MYATCTQVLVPVIVHLDYEFPFPGMSTLAQFTEYDISQVRHFKFSINKISIQSCLSA